MKVIYKIPLALSSLLALCGAAILCVDSLYLRPSFERRDADAARDNLDRVLAAVLHEGDHLANLDRDWSAWDDTYAFVVGGSPGYVPENLSADSWKQTGVDLMAIYGPDGTLRFQGRYDSRAARVVPEGLFPRAAEPHAPYFHTTDRTRDIVGFVDSPRGVYLLASTPIERTDGSGPVRGSFLMGRLVDPAFAAEISGQTSVSAELLPARRAGINAKAILAGGGKTLQIAGPEMLGYAVLPDLWGRPGLVIRAHTPRDISAWSGQILRITNLMIFALALLFVGLQFLLLLRIVVRPLGRLQQHVQHSETDDGQPGPEALAGRRDEIGSLAGAFQHLRESLAARRRDLQAANETLEARVEERTRELSRAGEDLRLLAKVVESTGDGVVILDLEGIVLRVNEAFCRISGYSRDELLGRSLDPLRSEKHDAVFYTGFREKLKANGAWQGEMWSRRRNGEIFASWLTVDLVRDPSGAPSCYVAVSSDITKVMAAEERLRQLNRISQAISRANQLIVHEKNRQALLREICRVAVEDGGVLMAWVGFVDPSTRQIVPAAWYGKEQGYLSSIQICADNVPNGRGPTGVAVRENCHVFAADIAAEPSLLPWKEEALARGYRSSAAFPLTERGQPVGAFSTYAGTVGFFDVQALSLLDGLAMDISYALENIDREEERRKLEEQFQQAQKMEAIGRLAGGIAHDFNNILTAISGYGELGVAESTGRQKDWFLQIRQAARRAANLTSQLLTFSRRQILRPRGVDLSALVTGMMDMLGRLLGDDIEVRVNPAEELWSVRADPGQLEQVVMNLAVNARDAMPRGGVLAIDTRNVRLNLEAARGLPAAPQGDYVLLTVSDTGHGMDSATLARIYEPFFTTKEVGKGTGLGLATVYGIVTQSGGHIRCESKIGEGTTFRVYLPRSTEARPPASGSGLER